MINLSYLPRHLSLSVTNSIHYLFDASNLTLPIYFSQKGRHEYVLVNFNDMFHHIQPLIEQLAVDYDIVVIPESRSSLLRMLTQRLYKVVHLVKRPKTQIFELVKHTPSWRKNDIQSAEKAMYEMGGRFTINTIKANKRKDYVPHLFEPQVVPQGTRVLLLDDFIMSGNTIKAMAAALGITEYDTLGIFYQV